MSFLLFIAVLVMAALVHDTRRRLGRMEGLVRDLELLFEGWAKERAYGAHTATADKDEPHETSSEAPQDAPPRPRPASISVPRSSATGVGMEADAHLPAPTQPERPLSAPSPFSAPPSGLTQRVADIRAKLMPPQPTTTPDAEQEQTSPHPAPIEAPTAPSGGGFEELFGRRLPIWAGGITLAVAGILLVKYSIDANLLPPSVRVILGLLFGSALIGGAEATLRQRERVRDDRVHQALSGAGIASLYASILAAANLYGLIGPGLAFAGLVLVTAIALGLSLRFGAPSAILGLAGGLAAPALVQASTPNVPLLCTYLALALGGLGAISRRQRWMWLGISALIGGAGWGLLLILMGGLDFFSTLSVGLLVLLAGVALPALVFPRSSRALLRGGGALVAAAQIALLIATGGFTPLHWGLYGLLSAAILWLAHRDGDLRLLPPAGLATGLLLSAIWPTPTLPLFVAVMLGLTALYGLCALFRLWRAEGGMLEAGQIIGLSLGGFAASWLHFHYGPAQDHAFVLLALGSAALPSAAAVLGWNRPERRAEGDRRFASLTTTVGLLLALAGLIGLPAWTAPILLAGIATALLALALKADDRGIDPPAQAFLMAAALALVATDSAPGQIDRLFNEGPLPFLPEALPRWGALALAAAFFAWRGRGARQQATFQVAASFFAYGTLAQILPAPWLAVAAAAGLAGLAEIQRRRWHAEPEPSANMQGLLPAMAGCAVLAALWALEPFTRWAGGALLSTSGIPLFVSDLPAPLSAVQHLLAPALLALFALWQVPTAFNRREGKAAVVLAAGIGFAGLHICYKQIFAIGDSTAFLHLGLAERTIWQSLLLAMGIMLWRWKRQALPALIPIGAALAHNLAYTMMFHNPLWSEQAVGPLPLANLLLPAFGLPFLALWLAERIAPEESARPYARLFDCVRMVAILLFAYASLRQLFSGSLLYSEPIGSVENIGWSVLALVLAIGFLLWGIRARARDWRIASLVLMLSAVAKVFLLDASGLEGLLRIASFLALGFSLIGVGWLYSRTWKEGEEQE